MKNRYVGILLNARVYNGIRSGDTGHEVLLQYVRTGERYGVTPCFIRLQDIRPGCSKVSAYVLTGREYVKKIVPMPAIVHNRAIYNGKRAKQKIERIARAGTIVFNRSNRHGKWYIHKLLMEDDVLQSHLPETMPFTKENLQLMMKRHCSLILKPVNGSVGKGILLLIRGEDGEWRVPDRLLRPLKSRGYVIQQRLSLAEYEGRPFDIRVSVQKDVNGAWQVTGMVGKVAAASSYLTNVAQGGQVVPVETIIASQSDLNTEVVKSDVTRLSLKVAGRLGEKLPGLADIGLDIGLLEDGYPMFIECNGRDLRYSFLNGGLLEEWTNTYGNPMGYASYLLNLKKMKPQKTKKAAPGP